MKIKLLLLCALLLMFARGAFAAGQSLEALEKLKAEGEQLYDVGDYRAAQKTWEVGLELSRSDEDKVWEASFLAKLAELQGDLGSNQIAFDFFEKAIKIAKSNKDEKTQAECYMKMSRIYAKLAKYKEAFSFNQKALEIFKKRDLKEGQVSALTDLGEYYTAKGEDKGAVAYIEEASRIASDIGDPRITGDNLLQVSSINKKMGNFEKARVASEQALDIFKVNNYDKGAAEALLNIGEIYSLLGNYGKAVSMFEDSLDISERAGYRTIIEKDLAGLGMVYKNTCDYAKSLIYLDNSISYSKESGSKEKLINNFYNFGYLYQSIGYSEKAQGYFIETIRILREMDDKNGIMNALVSLGGLHCEKGEYPAALACYQEALDIKKKLGLPYEDITMRMADIYIDMGNVQQAEKIIGKTIDPLRLGRLQYGKKKYTLTMPFFEQVIQENTAYNKFDRLFPSYCGLAGCHLGLWEYDKAKESFNEAINLVEAQREGLNDDEKYDFYSKTFSGFARSDPYEGMIRTLISTNDPKGAFVLSEKLKLDIFAAAAADKIEFARKELSEDNAKKEEGFLDKITLLRREMNAMNRKVDYSAKERGLKLLKESHDAFVEGLRTVSPRYTSVKYPRAMKLQDINIKANEVLLEFEITSDAAYLFMYDGYDKHFTLRPIAKTRKEMEEMINKYNRSFKRIDAAGHLAVFDARYSNKVYETIFGNILNGLPKEVNLIIIPDESLGALPFGSLVAAFSETKKGKGGKGESVVTDVEYLADNYLITYAQSGSALTFLRSQQQEPSRETSALAVCDPVFTPDPGNAGGGENQQNNIIEAISWWRKSHGGNGAFERLETANSIGKYFESLFPGKTTVLSGGLAKEETITKLLLSKYKYIAFGTHAILDSGAPWLRQPAVVLSQTGNEGNFDGFLTLDEIMLMKIPAETVTLPDCEAPVAGANISGEYAMSMGTAFQYAGAKNVLMSFWPVNDETAWKFNNTFIKNLKEGKEPAESLNIARKEIKESGFGHPYYWANYILVAR